MHSSTCKKLPSLSALRCIIKKKINTSQLPQFGLHNIYLSSHSKRLISLIQIKNLNSLFHTSPTENTHQHHYTLPYLHSHFPKSSYIIWDTQLSTHHQRQFNKTFPVKHFETRKRFQQPSQFNFLLHPHKLFTAYFHQFPHTLNYPIHSETKSNFRTSQYESNHTLASLEKKWLLRLSLIISLFPISLLFNSPSFNILCEEPNTTDFQPKAGEFREGLPVYTVDDVSKHGIGSERIWTTYRNGVYDITDFIKVHPGGSSRILLAAGSSIDPFWSVYAQHQTSQVHEMLEEMRIGNIDTESIKTHTHNGVDKIYTNEPLRHPSLIRVSQKPFNAETPLQILTDAFYTPNTLFFVRNHLPVPNIDLNTYSLEISSPLFKTPQILTFDDIQTKFPKRTIDATIQCAGNRRSVFNKFKPVKGLKWNTGAIGNASWAGVSLLDIMKYYGITEENAHNNKIKHIQFEGSDQDTEKQHYGASIPISYIFDRGGGDVLLAYEMNGQQLPLDHGFPLRVIVPGVVGARSVKWLKKIVFSEEESQSFWQRNDYRSFSPSIDWNNVDWRKAPSIQEYPVQSGICSPLEGTIVGPETEEITVRGYAWSGGGRAIIRVDVSLDNGITWHEAKRLNTTNTEEEEFDEVEDWSYKPVSKAWSWVIWSATIPVTEDLHGKQLELCCRAVDASYNTQPETPEPIWNLRGCLCNCWHRVLINVL